jgi:hypothetical protein
VVGDGRGGGSKGEDRGREGLSEEEDRRGDG